MRFFIAPIIFFIFASCNHDNSVPKNVLPTKKMEAVVWDVIRADEMINYRKIRDTTYTDKNAKLLFDTVFSLHHVSRQTFQKSLKYYQQHPQQLKVVLDSLQARSEASQVAISPAQ